MKSPFPNRMTLEDLTRNAVHLILGVREGHGFGFLNYPLVVVASLDGHKLETDIIPPSSDPLFAIELVWEADVKNIRRLRQANTPVKIECFSVNLQKRDRIGYILLSLKQAQVVPLGKKVNVVESWHRLLGVRSQMKALNPEMLLTLRIEDSPEESKPVKIDPVGVIGKSNHPINSLIPLLYANEGMIQIGSPEYGSDTFKLIVNTGFSSNIKCLIQSTYSKQSQSTDPGDYLTLCYSLMGYSIQTRMKIQELQEVDRDVIDCDDAAVINVRSNLKLLKAYFNGFPLVKFKLVMGDVELATTSLQLKDLIVVDNLLLFNRDKGAAIDVRCYLTPSTTTDFGLNKPFIDVSIRLTSVVSNDAGGYGDTNSFEATRMIHKYQGNGDGSGIDKTTILETILSPRKRTPQTITNVKQDSVPSVPIIDFDKVMVTSCQTPSAQNSPNFKIASNKNHGNCTYRCGSDNLSTGVNSFILDIVLNSVILNRLPHDGKITFSMHHPMAEVTCTEHDKISVEHVNEKICLPLIEAQFRFASTVNEINNVLMAEQPVVTIYDSHNKIFASAVLHTAILLSSQKNKECMYTAALETECIDNSSSKKQIGLLNVTMFLKDCGLIIKFADNQANIASAVIDKRVAYRVVEELEDWKERQQELYKNELKKKECLHLTMLSSEWTKRRVELEDNLNRNVEQCRALAQSLNEATDNMRERSRKNSEKERALALAEKELERKYELKFQELNEASNRMEADINHKLSLMKFEKTELLERITQLEREKKRLITNLQTLESDLDAARNNGLSKEQTANLLQEMKTIEEKLEAAQESKLFFKEQWGKAVREIHRLKKDHQLIVQTQIQREREELHKIQLCQLAREEEKQMIHDKNVLKELKLEAQDLTAQRQIRKHLQPCLSPGHADSGFNGLSQSLTMESSAPSLNNVQLRRLIDQRDQLLNSGAATNREMLAALNTQIRTLLDQMSV